MNSNKSRFNLSIISQGSKIGGYTITYRIDSDNGVGVYAVENNDFVGIMIHLNMQLLIKPIVSQDANNIYANQIEDILEKKRHMFLHLDIIKQDNDIYIFSDRDSLNIIVDRLSLIKCSYNGYEFDSILGEGAYGIVYKATRMKDNFKVAIKVVKFYDNNKTQTNSDGKTYNLKDKIIQEAKIINLCSKHPHILRYIDRFEDDENIYIVTEYMSDGDLISFVESNKRGFNTQQKKYITAQIISAVEYLHGNLLAHRDLKLDNILFEISSTGNINIKIADFGLAKSIDYKNNANTCVGSKYYMAPEVSTKKRYSPYKADIWSICVMLYVMETGFFPFDIDESYILNINNNNNNENSENIDVYDMFVFGKYDGILKYIEKLRDGKKSTLVKFEKYLEKRLKSTNTLKNKGTATEPVYFLIQNIHTKVLKYTKKMDNDTISSDFLDDIINHIQMIDLIGKIFIREKSRLSLEKIKNHPWIADHIIDSYLPKFEPIYTIDSVIVDIMVKNLGFDQGEVLVDLYTNKRTRISAIYRHLIENIKNERIEKYRSMRKSRISAISDISIDIGKTTQNKLRKTTSPITDPIRNKLRKADSPSFNSVRSRKRKSSVPKIERINNLNYSYKDERDYNDDTESINDDIYHEFKERKNSGIFNIKLNNLKFMRRKKK